MKVETGLGYYLKEGKIIGKYSLPIGEHPLSDGYTFVEVADQEALDAVEVYVEPEAPEILEAREREQLIEAKKRELAIEALKSEGKLDVDAKLTIEGKASLSIGKSK